MGMTRVLLVDDARLMAELGSTAMGRASFELRPVRPGQDIVALAKACQPDVVLLRDGESCPDGFEACRSLKADPETRSIPVIYIGLGLDRERYGEAGVNLFIPRPMTRHDLKEALRRVLRVKDRVALRQAVDIRVELQLGPAVVKGRCVNLSLSGAYIHLDRRVTVGQRGILRFQAGGRLLEMRSEIVREDLLSGVGSAYGVCFVGLESATAAYLSRYVRAAGDRRVGEAPRPMPGEIL